MAREASRTSISPGGRAAAGAVRVGVILNTVGGYSRAVIRGIGSFALSRGWRCRVEGVNATELPRQLADFHGLIVQAGVDELHRLVAHCPCPVVNVSSALSGYAAPSVVTDDVGVGRMGADYLLRLGYRRLVFFVPDDRQFALLRHRGFSRRCADASAVVAKIETRDELAAHLQALDGPTAVMGCNDRAALVVCDVAREVGRRVPEDLAVLGVDNDDLVQSVAHPPLSTINTSRERIGFEAAALLERMLEGEKVPQVTLVPARGVIARRSTEGSAVDDATVRQAVLFIEQSAARRIGVQDVADAVSISRRQLERRFAGVLGRSVHEEIGRVRIEQARRLLLETDLTLPQVADACGYGSASYFNTAFTRATGTTPAAFRHRFEWA